jgi:multisubunit Na+/H+ antiporter MnhE subunit
MLFETLFLVWLLLSNQLNFKNKTVNYVTAGVVATAIFTVISYTIYRCIIHFLTGLFL